MIGLHDLLCQVTLHIAYVHAFVNPALFLALHRGLRQGMTDVCCGCCESIARWILGSNAANPVQNVQPPRYQPPMNLPSPPDPPLGSAGSTGCDFTDVALLKPPLPPTTKHLLMVEKLVALLFAGYYCRLYLLRNYSLYNEKPKTISIYIVMLKLCRTSLS